MRPIVLSDLKHSPFSLVTFAYQAGLCSQGIPGWKSLITAHQHQQISSLDLIQKAVEANLLPSQLLTNQEYLSAVDNSLYLYYLKQPESETVSLIDESGQNCPLLPSESQFSSSSKPFLPFFEFNSIEDGKTIWNSCHFRFYTSAEVAEGISYDE